MDLNDVTYLHGSTSDLFYLCSLIGCYTSRIPSGLTDVPLPYPASYLMYYPVGRWKPFPLPDNVKGEGKKRGLLLYLSFKQVPVWYQVPRFVSAKS